MAYFDEVWGTSGAGGRMKHAGCTAASQSSGVLKVPCICRSRWFQNQPVRLYTPLCKMRASRLAFPLEVAVTAGVTLWARWSPARAEAETAPL
jgi:hypothetical protein